MILKCGSLAEYNVLFAGMLWWLRVIPKSKAGFQNGSKVLGIMSGRNEEIDLDHRGVFCSDLTIPVL